MNTRNTDALMNATGEFSFSPGATTSATAQATGYLDFGNIVAIGLNPSSETLEHEGSYRGKRTVDKTVVIKAGFEYTVKVDEFDVEKLKLALFGNDGTDFTQTVKSSQAIDALAFGTTAAVLNRWYDILVSGVRVREMTALTITGKTENTDFVVDYKAGRVRFLTAQSSNLSGTVSAPAVTAGGNSAFQALTPLQTYRRTGIGRLMLFDDAHPNVLVYDHHDFGCEVLVDSMDEMDGKKFGVMTLKVKVTSPVGTVYSAE